MRTTILVVASILVALGSGAAADPVVSTFYVGFEDLEARDYDYNDFGMRMSVVESRERGELVAIELLFESRLHLGGDVHDIHVTRRFAPEIRYAYSVDRTRAAEGTEHAATLGPVYGAGDLDLVVFDSAFAVPGDFVRVRIDLEEPQDAPAFDPSDSPYALDASWGRYDLWLFNRTAGVEHHLADAQPFRTSDVELPYVLVLPSENWEPPAEGDSVPDAYPDFIEYFATGDDDLRTWFETDPALR